MPYKRGAVCERGHPVRADVTPHDPADPFCQRCGAPTVTACGHCSEALRGRYFSTDRMTLVGNGYSIPKHCFNCGKAFPWTQRALDEIAELARDEGGIDEDDTARLIEAVESLSSDGQPDAVAASRFKKIVAKAGGPTGKAIEQIAVQVISAAAKATLGI